MPAWPFSRQLSSGPPSYRPTAPRPSDPAGSGMGSVRSIVYARFHWPISRVPFPQNLLSRNGSLGCSLRCVHEASDFPPILQGHSRRRGEADFLAERRCPGEGVFLADDGEKGTGSVLDRENRALIGCCWPKLRFSGALMSNITREHARHFRVFCRECKNRGLDGGEGRIRTPETLQDSRGRIQP